MFGRLIIALAFVFVTVPGLAQYQNLLNKTYAQRYLAQEKMFYSGRALSQDSATFFKELEQLTKAAEKAGDEELQLEARLLRAEYYMYGQQTNHQAFEPLMLELRNLADKNEIKHLQIRTRQKLGYYYFAVKHQYGPGFDNYLSSYPILKQVTVNEVPDKQEMVANIGTAYYQFGDPVNARKFLTEAFEIAPSYKKRLPINLTNTLGLIYREEHKYDSADFYLWKTYRMAEAIKDSTWMGIAAGNIGISYYHQKKFQEAIPLLEMDIRESLKAHEMDNAVNSQIILANIYLIRKDLDKARDLIRQINRHFPETANKYQHLKGFYPLLARYYALTGNYQAAYRYSDSAHFVKDSLQTRRNSILTTKAEQKIELEKHRAEMQQLEAEDKIRTLQRNGLLGGIILLVIIALLVINRQRLVHRQKQEKLEKEKSSIESELELASRQLNNFTDHIREKNKLIEKYSAELKNHQDRFGAPEQQAHMEARDKLLKSTILTDDQWEEFRQLFDKVHAGYLQRLREKLPVLSPAETRYFVLSKLKLTSKEMASMLGVRPDAIRLYRHRLRKKLNIEEDAELEEMVNTI